MVIGEIIEGIEVATSDVLPESCVVASTPYVDMPRSTRIAVYDMDKGLIAKYELQPSDDGFDWVRIDN